jgi:hypothetical protein
MTMRKQLAWAIAGTVVLTLGGAAHAGGIGSKAKEAVDPDCTAAKGAKGAAMKATVGVGNRCDVAETTRDTLGIDDRDKKKKKNDGLLRKRKKN